MARLRRFSPEEIKVLREMVRNGASGLAIAKRLNRDPGIIRTKCCDLGLSLRPPRNNDKRRVVLTADTVAALSGAAKARGIGIARLANELLTKAVRHDLVTRILDDASSFVRPTTATHVNPADARRARNFFADWPTGWRP